MFTDIDIGMGPEEELEIVGRYIQRVFDAEFVLLVTNCSTFSLNSSNAKPIIIKHD